jgi:hypothetical protein
MGKVFINMELKPPSVDHLHNLLWFIVTYFSLENSWF